MKYFSNSVANAKDLFSIIIFVYLVSETKEPSAVKTENLIFAASLISTNAVNTNVNTVTKRCNLRGIKMDVMDQFWVSAQTVTKSADLI